MKIYKILIVAVLTVTSCKESKETVTETPSVETQQDVSNNDVSEISESETSTGSENYEEGSSLTGSESNLNIDITLASDQLFDFDKAILKAEAEPALQNVFDQINGKTKSKIEIIGYTDSKGSDSYNKNLSVQRAEAVKKWLEEKGLANPISIKGKGAENPIAPNTNADGSDNPEGRAKNRRVEIKASKQQAI